MCSVRTALIHFKKVNSRTLICAETFHDISELLLSAIIGRTHHAPADRKSRNFWKGSDPLGIYWITIIRQSQPVRCPARSRVWRNRKGNAISFIADSRIPGSRSSEIRASTLPQNGLITFSVFEHSRCVEQR